MARILFAVGVALLFTDYASAQSEANCEQIRQAIATHGYAAARQHALAHYGAETVRNGDKKCGLTPEHPAKRHVKHQKPRKRK